MEKFRQKLLAAPQELFCLVRPFTSCHPSSSATNHHPGKQDKGQLVLSFFSASFLPFKEGNPYEFQTSQITT